MSYQCPKCDGTDYFMSKRNVKGVVFTRLTTRDMPVCRKCDEIMSSNLKLNPIIPKFLLGVLLILVVVGFIF